MTREEIKKGLISYLDSIKWEIGEYHEVFGSLINMLSLSEKDEWIPVSERLPEKNVWVLVTVEQSGKCFQEIMRRNNYIEAWTDNIDNYIDEITAWMPLPEPYQKGGEE